MSRLVVRYAHDADDVGRLQVEVHTPRFSGMGGVWAYADILAEFASTLAAYPLPTTRKLELGNDDLLGDDRLLLIEISSLDARGTLLAQVEIADGHEPWKRVRTQFITHYPELERFQRALNLLAAGAVPEAVLSGE